MASLRLRPCSATPSAADKCEHALVRQSSTRLLATGRVSVGGNRTKGHKHIRFPLLRVSAGLGSPASPVGDINSAAAETPVATPKGQQFYEWKPGKRVAYRVVLSSSSDGVQDEEPPILLLTGFGVGNFHYDRLLQQLEGIGSDVYLLDWFGQGDSWPTVDPCPSPEPSSQAGFEHGFGPGPAVEEFEGFRFSADMWTEQAEFFLEEIVGRPAVLCGNSLGGFVAANLVAKRPDLAEGLVLLNATPFWGLTFTGLWDGVYPLPKLYRSLGVTWWNWIRDPSTIRTMLDFVYAKPMAQGGYHEALVDAILAPTQQRAAASVFCSILSSPPPTRTFDEMLDIVREAEIPCILAYGRDDPWIVPLWGLRAHRRLTASANVQGGSDDKPQQLPAPDNSRYYEMTPAGHCPQDEAPKAVALLIRNFMHSLQQQDEGCCGRLRGMMSADELNEQLRGRTDVEIRLHALPKPRTPVEALDAAVFAVQQRMRASKK